MTFTNLENNLKYFSFDKFPTGEVGHGIFTRLAGVSPSPWDSLNLGGLVGDSTDNIIENRKLLFDGINRPVESLYDVWQVHSSDVLCVDAPRPLNMQHVKADGILTNNPDVTLLMRFADCVPILLYDPIKKVVGLVHAGWQGTVKKIAEVAIRQMQAAYGSIPENIIAGIGSSIGPDHYEVGQEVISKVELSFGETANKVLINISPSRIHFDLWSANRWILEQTGVKQIEIAGICTVCNKREWFSHRGNDGKTGRFGAVIYLKSRND